MDLKGITAAPGQRHQLALLPFIIIGALVVTSLLLLTSGYFWLAIIPSIAVISILVLSKRPQLATYALILFIPFGAFKKFSLGDMEINITWLIAGMVSVILVVQTLVAKQAFTRLNMSLWPLLGLLMLSSLISTWLSPYPDAANKSFLLWLAALVFMAIALMTITRKAFFDTLPSLLIGSVFISSFLGNLSFFTSITLFNHQQLDGAFSRNLGGALDANNLSLMVIACLPLVVHRLIYATTGLKKLFYLAILTNSVLAVGTSYSRGGMLVFLLASFLVLLEFRQTYQARRLGFLLLALTIGFSAFVVMMPETFWQRQSSLTDWSDSSLQRRTAYLYVARDAFMQNPLFGTGPDTFYQIFADTNFARLDKSTGRPLGRYAHNTYVEVLVGTGVIGLTLFLFVIILALNKFSRMRNMYLLNNQPRLAHLLGGYRLMLINVMIYLVIFSEAQHKFMLLGLVLSQLAERYYQKPGQDDDHG